MTTVADLKLAVQRHPALGVAPNYQRLLFQGRELLDHELLSSVHVADQVTLHLVLRQPSMAMPQGPVAYQAGSYGAPPHPFGGPGAAGGVYAAPPGAAPGGGFGPAMGAPVVVAVGPGGGQQFPQVDQERIIAAQQLSRIVKMFAIIDGVFALIFFFFFYFFIIGVVMSTCGYYGARHFRPSYVLVYLVWMFINVIARGVFIYFASSVASVVLLVLGIAIELYLIRIVIYFYRLLRSMRDDELTALQALSQLQYF